MKVQSVQKVHRYIKVSRSKLVSNQRIKSIVTIVTRTGKTHMSMIYSVSTAGKKSSVVSSIGGAEDGGEWTGSTEGMRKYTWPFVRSPRAWAPPG